MKLMNRKQLQMDVAFLARRAALAGSFICDAKRDWGISSNSLVALAYGAGQQIMPCDWSDYAACVRAVRQLPWHRRTPHILKALRRAKIAVLSECPPRKMAA